MIREFFKYLKCLVLLLFAAQAMAMEAPSGTSTLKPESYESSKKMPIERLRLFVNTFPVPILSEGMGVGAEVTLNRFLAVWLVTDKSTWSTSDALIDLGESVSVTRQKQQLALRYFFSEIGYKSVFLHAGYQWTKIYSRSDPGLLNGVAATKVEFENGAYAGIGYRLLQSKNPNWMADFEVNYEPGGRGQVDYVADEVGFFGASKAHLETEFEYGPALRARVGYNF